MPQNSTNRMRVFADIVSIDAWHRPFGKRTKVDLHADVVFGTARVGGEPDSPVRFRLRVRRAELVIIIPESEPVSIDQNSVSRDTPEMRAKLTQTIRETSRIAGKAGVAASGSASGIRASVNFEADAGASLSSDKTFELSGDLQPICATLSKDKEGNYRWILEPVIGDHLDGRPWDAKIAPRLKLVDSRKDRSKGIPPSVRIEVRCRREDLIIDDLQIKDESKWQAVKHRLGFQNRLAAAEAYIRDRLVEEGLEVESIGDIFGQLALGSVTAEPMK